MNPTRCDDSPYRTRIRIGKGGDQVQGANPYGRRPHPEEDDLRRIPFPDSDVLHVRQSHAVSVCVPSGGLRLSHPVERVADDLGLVQDDGGTVGAGNPNLLGLVLGQDLLGEADWIVQLVQALSQPTASTSTIVSDLIMGSSRLPRNEGSDPARAYGSSA